MRAGEVHCNNGIREGWRGIVGSISISICMSVALMTGASGLYAEPARTVVSPIEQTTRDDERLRILREELKRSEASLEALGRRRAERLAAADIAAADEAEDQSLRALSDIAALKREIASASRTNQEALARPHASPARTGQPPAVKSAPPRPWWDVYGNSRRHEVSPSNSSSFPFSFSSSSSLSFASPPIEAGTRSVSAHRLE